MKALLLASVAVMGVVVVGNAAAQEPALQLGISGHTMGYMVYTGGDDLGGKRRFDFRKHGEIGLGGQVSLDNGITAGAYFEMHSDRYEGGEIKKSFVHLSSNWGRINFGEEDGATYLLQVAAPSADDNIDGLRPKVGTIGFGQSRGYAQDEFGYRNKITYFTPVFNGFQAGVSYTPTVGLPRRANRFITNLTGTAMPSMPDLNGLAPAVNDKQADMYSNGFEFAGRYEGSFDAVDVALGAGYSHAGLESKAASTVFNDSLTTWNVGANVGYDAFGFGAAYLHSNNGIKKDADFRMFVLGADYKFNAYTFGVSYQNGKQDYLAANTELKTQQWTAGSVYEWGPGMSFRGAVQYVDSKLTGLKSVDNVQFTLGTEMSF